MSAGLPGPFVGRDDELQVLEAAFHQVGQGETAAVFIRGNSGVGKTCLLKAAASRIAEAGATILAATCVDFSEGQLNPLKRALKKFVSDNGGSGAAEIATDLVESLNRVPRPAVPGDWLETVLGGLSKLTGASPLVIQLEEIQWIDSSTCLLLKHLLAVPGGLKFLLIGTVRSEAAQRNPSIRQQLSEWMRNPSVHGVTLEAFNRDQTAELAATLLGRQLASAELELVWSRSSGNASVVDLYCRSLRKGTLEMPDSVRQFAMSRVEPLPEDSRTAVTRIAIGIEPVDHELLRQVLGFDDARLIAALRTAWDEGIIAGDDQGYAFRMGVFKEVLTESLLPVERTQLHSAYADALRADPDLDPHSTRLIHHLRLGKRPREALEAAVSAAHEARGDEFGHWASAMEIIGELKPGEVDAAARLDMARLAAKAGLNAGEYERVLEFLPLPEVDGSASLPCWFHLARAGCLKALGQLAGAEAAFTAAQRSPDATDGDRAVAASHAAAMLVRLGQYGGAGTRAREALRLADIVGDSSSALRASAALGFSLAALDDPLGGLATVEDALRRAEQSGRHEDIGSAFQYLAELQTGPLNLLDSGITVALEGAERCDRAGLGRTQGAMLRATAANGLFRTGKWAQAQAVINAGFGHGPVGTEAAELLLARCRLHTSYGDRKAAQRDLDAVATLVAGAGGARFALPLLILRAGLAMWENRHDVARAAIIEAIEHGHGLDDHVTMATAVWHGLRAEAEALDSPGMEIDHAAVRTLGAELERIKAASAASAGPVRDMVDGYLSLCDGERSRIDGRPEPQLWAHAAQIWEKLDHPYPAAYSRLRLAEACYKQRIRHKNGRAALLAAYETATGLGAVPLKEQIVALARRVKVSLPSEKPFSGRAQAAAAEATGLDLLTKREGEVLTLIAKGRTNSKIAVELGISEKTVAVHITNLMKKLRVENRFQAIMVYFKAHPSEVTDR